MYQFITSALVSLSLMACSTSSPMQAETFYDYQLFSPNATPISLQKLPQDILEADVILVGELHSHTGIHHFQTDLFNILSAQGRTTALSMEQFSRDSQPVIDKYLSGEIGEQTLIKDADAWPNYESDYRSIVELAKARQLDIIAANAPKNIVRCIGKQGISYLDKLKPKQRATIATNVNTQPSPYKDKFMASMHHGVNEKAERYYAAQITWDETMAESITDYVQLNPKSQILHIGGKFHIEQGLGMKASILARQPNLKVVVITPNDNILSNSQDYQLEVLPFPYRYIKEENWLKESKKLSKRNDDLTCM
ncbi:ChaN family lipoprotein [Vibrio hepatarius]|uniref:ChaN family lipoprotein n=1 Tax=Vibrio hepatarius TaxID=171383 RepID=UPI001C09B818|nr:ChaN family lipoprotein [Vibrio hepatarius]MBU2895441.1 ChaN family lipoprotein [Vibrio hepatarius]